MQEELEKYFDRLFPLYRSITGEGVRETLKILQELIPLEQHEAPAGKKVLDWEIPPEWNVREAYMITPEGERIADIRDHPLHLMGYSEPVNKVLSKQELKDHIFTLPEQPEAIPYITSYYSRYWGFCMKHKQWEALPENGKYRVYIDSNFNPEGSLTYGDVILPGKSQEEIFLSTYICHPGMAVNELSGPLTLAMLYRKIAGLKNRHYTYRFVFAPETIGAINYLHENGNILMKNMKAGYIVNCLGLDQPFVYKQTREPETLTNKVTEHLLQHEEKRFTITDFVPMGSDERQYASPGFNLPVGVLTSTIPGTYPQYHTSLDNKELISFSSLEKGIELYFHLVQAFEINGFYVNTLPYGEPQLGKRGLYPELVGKGERSEAFKTMMYLLNFADGYHDLIDIAEKRQTSVLGLQEELELLLDKGILSVSASSPSQKKP